MIPSLAMVASAMIEYISEGYIGYATISDANINDVCIAAFVSISFTNALSWFHLWHNWFKRINQ